MLIYPRASSRLVVTVLVPADGVTVVAVGSVLGLLSPCETLLMSSLRAWRPAVTVLVRATVATAAAASKLCAARTDLARKGILAK